jgi:signal peptidase I
MAARKEEKFEKNEKKSLKKKFDKLTEGPFGYVVYAFLGVVIAFLLNQALAFALETDLPVVAVVSGSMVHDSSTAIVHYKWLQDNLGYNRSYVDSWPVKDGFLIGDLPIIAGAKNYSVGDVIVYSVPGQQVPIIHRIIKINSDGSFTTKGDHNDRSIQFPGTPYSEYSIQPSWVHGKVIFIIPKLGYFKVILTSILSGGRA